MQVLITPDCYTNAGTLIPMAIHRRVVTPATPKKQWRTTSLRTNPSDVIEMILTRGAVLADDEISDFTEKRMRYAFSMLDELLKHDWKIRNTPILTEISRYDADDIAKGNTPNKVLYRINISRKSQGFPAELV